MAEGRDLIVAAALIDTLVFSDGRAEENVPGGAGLYALAGAALFSDAPVLVTGTGKDFVHSFGPWLADNGLSTDGLRLADPNTPRNLLRYLDERTRTETPVFGEVHFRKIEPQPADLERMLPGARSAYVFRNTDAAFWDGVIRLRGQHDFVLVWEIGLDACTPEELPRIEALLAHVDAISLNLEEAALIFSTASEAQLLQRLQGWPVERVFLRAGRRGSFVIADGTVKFVSSLKVEPIDVTGGGNAYSGAALVGLAQGRSAIEAAAMGTVAASVAIGQLGLPRPGDRNVRAAAWAQFETLMERLSKEAFA